MTNYLPDPLDPMPQLALSAHDLRVTIALTTCPQCHKTYEPAQPRGLGNAAEREQHITGLCSFKCWNDYLGTRRYCPTCGRSTFQRKTNPMTCPTCAPTGPRERQPKTTGP